jgi:hypothetical protein
VSGAALFPLAPLPPRVLPPEPRREWNHLDAVTVTFEVHWPQTDVGALTVRTPLPSRR